MIQAHLKEIHAELLRKHLNRFQRIQEEEEDEEEHPQALHHKDENPEQVDQISEPTDGMCFNKVSYAFQSPWVSVNYDR